MDAFGLVICKVPSPVGGPCCYKLAIWRRRGAQEIIWCTYPRSVTLSVFTDVSLQGLANPLGHAVELLELSAVLRLDRIWVGRDAASFHWCVPLLGSVSNSLVDDSETYAVIAAAAAQIGLRSPIPLCG